ncbi:MAG: PQQ-dependent sugar dehydrogenase [Aquabacterium sp.]
MTTISGRKWWHAAAMALMLVAGCGGGDSPPAEQRAGVLGVGGPTSVDHVLTVTKAGLGFGRVKSTPVGIDCGRECSRAFAQGTNVVLTASTVTDSVVAGWSGGGCSGTRPTCTVSMTEAKTVTVTFDPVIGLGSRPNNLTCHSFDPPISSTASLSLAPAFTSLPSFATPIAMLQAPSDGTRWFVVEKGGRVRVFANGGSVSTSSVFIDISALVRTSGEEEAGLLGMAFDPKFGTGPGKNQYFYLFYTGAPNSGYRLRSTVSRFTADGTLTSASAASEVKLLTLDKLETNHNGGNIAFGPDGHLYIGFGDGGGDPNPQAQDDKYLFGKILRIDPSSSTGNVPYAIPADNPNAGQALCNATGRGAAACPEVWARGLRNPWRWSFDKLNGRMWVGDVGWGGFEEVNIVTRGGNYGWPIMEGASCVTPGCNQTGLIRPVHAVARSDAQAITGGYVYRGTQTTDLSGQYIYGDFASKMFGALISGIGGTYTPRTLIAPYSANSINVASFGEDIDGELFALNYVNGRIYKLVFSTGGGSNGPNVPALLSATGCVDPANPKLPASGLVGYDINAAFWSDNAVKQRYFALPSTTAAFAHGTDGDWSVPLRSVFVKNFLLGGKMIETRLLMRQSDGDWAGYSYEWNDAQTDATLVASTGKEKTISGQLWSYPSRGQCLQCHTSAAGFSLGLENQQVNRQYTYAQTGIKAHQLTTLSALSIAMLTPPITKPATLPVLANPTGTGSVNDRARAYLHVNCSMCHRPGGATPVALNLLVTTPLASTNTCDVTPTKGTLGLTNARIVAPGAPDRSVLLARLNTRDPLVQMPPIGSHVIDTGAVSLLHQWIAELGTCN